MHSDSGIVLGTDREGNVVIDRIEAYSPASKLPIVMKGLRLIEMNDIKVNEENSSSSSSNNGYSRLKKIRKMISLVKKEKIKFVFLEPNLTLTSFNHVIDIEIKGSIYTMKLPLGAVYDMKAFSVDVQEMIWEYEYPLRKLVFDIDTKNKQVYLSTQEEEDLPFRLLLQSGEGDEL